MWDTLKHTLFRQTLTERLHGVRDSRQTTAITADSRLPIPAAQNDIATREIVHLRHKVPYQ